MRNNKVTIELQCLHVNIKLTEVAVLPINISTIDYEKGKIGLSVKMLNFNIIIRLEQFVTENHVEYTHMKPKYIVIMYQF